MRLASLFLPAVIDAGIFYEKISILRIIPLQTKKMCYNNHAMVYSHV